jgi:hypothetical protein
MVVSAWLLGLGRNPDPSVALPHLRTKIATGRLFTFIFVFVGLGAYWRGAEQAPGRVAVPYDQMSFALSWGVLLAMAMLMPNIGSHTVWTPARRRLVTQVIWISAILLVIAAAWDIGLYWDRRWGYFWAWQGLYLGLTVGLGLLCVLGWFTLAGNCLAMLARCDCPSPMKRWMRTAPIPRRLAGPHVCPRFSESEEAPAAA